VFRIFQCYFVRGIVCVCAVFPFHCNEWDSLFGFVFVSLFLLRRMMKVFALLAIVAVAVSAEYTYKCPELPCIFEMKMKGKLNGTSTDLGKFTVADHFLRIKAELGRRGDDDTYIVFRPDITSTEGGKKMIGGAMLTAGACKTEMAPWEECEELLNTLRGNLFGHLEYLSWDTKETVEYEGEQCTSYSNSSVETGSLIVCNEYPYYMNAGGNEVIYEWKFEVDMDKFQLEECEGDFAKVPEEKYVVCDASYSSGAASSSGNPPKSSNSAASSIHAVSALVFALIAVALF